MKLKGTLKSVLEHMEVNYSNPRLRIHLDTTDDNVHSARWLLAYLDNFVLQDSGNSWTILSGGDYYDCDIYKGDELV